MAAAILIAALLALAAARAARAHPSAGFVTDALCVHSGWHWTSHRPRHGGRPEYVLWGHGFWRTWDVPDSIAGGSGEAGWTEVNSYGGGLQFMLGTWNRAAALSHGRVPFLTSNAQVAAQPPRVQILAMWLIVRSDGGSFREWPNTGRACGLN